MCTDGLGECTGVIIRASCSGWDILCHADTQTDLRTGVLQWVKEIPADSGVVTITYDIMEVDRRRGHDPYAPQIDAAISELSKEHRVIKRLPEDPKGGTGAIIYRQRDEVRYLRDARWTLEESGATVESGDMQTYIGSIGELLGESRYPPICVFDRRGTLTIDDIKKQHSALQRAFDDVARESHKAGPV